MGWRDDVCHPKHEGWLGIRPLRDVTKALKVEWLWRFDKENTLWKNMVKVKYDDDRFRLVEQEEPSPSWGRAVEINY